MKKIPQNFFLAFIDELENTDLLKKLLKWVNRKHKNFNIHNVVFFKKLKEKRQEISLFYNCIPKILMISSTVPEI